ncbi:hypothetical protein CSUI_003126, partial [Cystoisospora suis]
MTGLSVLSGDFASAQADLPVSDSSLDFYEDRAWLPFSRYERETAHLLCETTPGRKSVGLVFPVWFSNFTISLGCARANSREFSLRSYSVRKVVGVSLRCRMIRFSTPELLVAFRKYEDALLSESRRQGAFSTEHGHTRLS